MAIKGSLKEASLADVCQLLAMGQKTGSLSVTDRSNFGQVFFDRGRITFARIVNRRDRLGDLLVADGLLAHDRLREAVEQQTRAPDRRLGELLIENGWITEQQLEQYIRLQIEEAVYYLFTWSQGSFYFEVGQRPEEAEMLVSINPESLLLEGARRVDEWSLIEKKIPSLDLLFEVEADRLRSSEVEITPEQERLLPLLDGSRTVQDLVDETGLVEFEVGKALYGLIQAGFAHRVGQRDTSMSTERARESEVTERRNLGIAFYRAGMTADATREFRRVLEIRADDNISRYHLALLAIRERRDRDAVRRLKEMLEETGPRFGGFVNLAYALHRIGRETDALLVLDEAESLRPESAATALVRATIQLSAGDLSAAEESLAAYRERLGETATPAPVYYHHAALVAAALGDADAAKDAIDSGLAAYPGSAPLHLLAGAVAERSGGFDEAEDHYRRAVEEDTQIAQAHKSLGDLAYRKGLHEDAIEQYQKTIRIDPEIGDDVYTKLGNLHYKRQQRDDAIQYWQRALELNPENHVVRNNLDVVVHAAR